MSESSTDALIEAIAAEAGPVRPLAPPLARAGAALIAFVAIGALLVLWRGAPGAPAAYHGGGEWLPVMETAAMLATALLAVTGAFALSVPGGSRKWLAAALAALAAWVALSSAECWTLMREAGDGDWVLRGHPHCFYFITGFGVAIGTPLLWLLSRARPIDPMPVALLGGIGAAALAGLLLIFFHPFSVTFIDLAFHLLAVAIVIGAAAIFRRRALPSA